VVSVARVRFRIEQHLAAPVERVEAALLDPGWYEAVTASTAVWAAELLDVADDGGPEAGFRVRYRFRGTLNPAAAKVVSPSKLSMVWASTLDRRTHALTLDIEPDHYGDRLRFTRAAVVLRPDGVGTARVLEGDFSVKVPFVGGKVEAAVVSGLREHAAVEERAFAAFVGSGR
jgi:hypothetical protein